jgi:OOP family OmpA-OmpF porin
VNQGVAPSRVTAIGLGETQPKATNNTPEGRQLNRRVEIHIRATQPS